MFYSFQTKLMTDLKSMTIVPMHEWKVPLKYRAMLLFPSGPLGLGGAADTMVWGGVPTKWWEQKSTSTYILKLRRNSTRVPYFVTEASSHRHSTATAIAAARHSPLATRHSPLATRHHYNHGGSVASASLSLSSLSSSSSLPSPPSPPPLL